MSQHWIKTQVDKPTKVPGRAQSLTTRSAHKHMKENKIHDHGQFVIHKGILDGSITNHDQFLHAMSMGQAYEQSGLDPKVAYANAIEHKTIPGMQDSAEAGDVNAATAMSNISTRDRGQDFKPSASGDLVGKSKENASKILQAVETILNERRKPVSLIALAAMMPSHGVKLHGTGTEEQAKFLRRVLTSAGPEGNFDIQKGKVALHQYEEKLDDGKQPSKANESKRK